MTTHAQPLAKLLLFYASSLFIFFHFSLFISTTFSILLLQFSLKDLREESEIAPCLFRMICPDLAIACASIHMQDSTQKLR